MRTLRKEFIVCVFFLTTIRWREITGIRGDQSDCLSNGKETVLLDLHTPAGQIELPLHHRGPPRLRFPAICSVSRAADQTVEQLSNRRHIAFACAFHECSDNGAQVILGDRLEDERAEAGYFPRVRIPGPARVPLREAAIGFAMTV